MLNKIFGNQLSDIDYHLRAGAFGVLLRNDDTIATLKTKNGNILIGDYLGKCNTLRDALKQGCLEKAGLYIDIEDFICKTETYSFVDHLDNYFNTACYFFFISKNTKVKNITETNTDLEWISLHEIKDKICLDNEVWVLQQASKKRKPSGD